MIKLESQLYFLILFLFSVFEVNASEISSQSVLSSNVTNYIVSKKNIGRFNEGQTSYFAPVDPNKEAVLIQKFTFDQIIDQAFLNLSLSVFNFGNGRFGNGAVWVSKDGDQWVKILDTPTPTKISNSERYNQNLPNEILGGKSIWVRTRLFANNLNVTAQFLRYTAGSDVNAFDLRVEFEEVVEVSDQKNEIEAEGGDPKITLVETPEFKMPDLVDLKETGDDYSDKLLKEVRAKWVGQLRAVVGEIDKKFLEKLRSTKRNLVRENKIAEARAYDNAIKGGEKSAEDPTGLTKILGVRADLISKTVRPINKKYWGKLKEIREDFREGGNLEGVVIVDEEIQRLIENYSK